MQGDVHVGEDSDDESPAPSVSKPATVQTQTSTQAAAPETKENKAAEAEKAKGNALYLKKQFKEALECYNKAREIDPSNAVYLLNISAVHFEQGLLDETIADCQEALRVGQANKLHYTFLAKIYLRWGNALAKQAKHQEAIDMYKKSLLEDLTPAAKQALKKCEEAKKLAEEQAYLDPAKSEEAKERGNAKFKEQKWVEAITEYTEALKRDPTNYKVYSNRAACYTKLMEWQRGLDDCEKCLKFDKTFVKAYIRKGKIQHFLKQYHKALDTYQKGLEFDKQNEELLDGLLQTKRAIQQENMSGNVDQQRQAEAMKDPEIQAILRDPVINQVLQDMQNNPATAQNALRDKGVMEKINKLVAAGVLRIG
jgi:stress-induced-phosphoprotein 1